MQSLPRVASPDLSRYLAGRTRREWGVHLAWFAAAVGGLAGVGTLVLHLTSDPLADVHAYYDAAARLNAGLSLYPANANTDLADFYRYPPLLAIAFRPLALLPFDAAAGIWEVICVATFVLTLYRVGWRRPETWIAVGVLGIAVGWALPIGQAQVPMTWLLAIGSPWAVALATNLKIFPALVAIYWLSRREWRPLAVFGIWMVGLFLVQLILEPAGTIAFFGITNLSQVGAVKNMSPYALSPILWVGSVAALVLVAWRLAPTRWGWAAAIGLSILATPRLLSYMLMTFLAALRGGDASSPVSGRATPGSEQREVEAR